MTEPPEGLAVLGLGKGVREITGWPGREWSKNILWSLDSKHVRESPEVGAVE